MSEFFLTKKNSKIIDKRLQQFFTLEKIGICYLALSQSEKESQEKECEQIAKEFQMLTK